MAGGLAGPFSSAHPNPPNLARGPWRVHFRRPPVAFHGLIIRVPHRGARSCAPRSHSC